MRPVSLLLCALLLLTVSCRLESGGESPLALEWAAFQGNGPTLLVDDDGADCQNADFATIQAAVDAAEAYITILVCAGTYNERVLITGPDKTGLRVRAHGAPDAVVLDGIGLPPPGPPGSPTGNHGFHLRNVSEVLIEGFTLRRYFENIRLTDATDSRIRKNRTSAAGHDGINLTNSTRNIVEHNESFDNLSGNACGVLLALASTDNIIRHNEFRNNNWGIRVVGASANNYVFGNYSHENRTRGIQNIGAAAARTVIENNRTERNPVGIEVGAPGVTVARNRSFLNTTFDIVNTGLGNTFFNNHCDTSDPAGLCTNS